MERPKCSLCGGRHYSYEEHVRNPAPKPRTTAKPKPENASALANASPDAKPFLNLKQAREFLGVSRTKLWELVREGRLTLYRAPLDKRVRLVRREDLEALLIPQRGQAAEAGQPQTGEAQP